jgi:DNA-directed RNA polymerase subunit omega
MAQDGFDKLISKTDSRYRLSMIVALRAAQIKAGLPPLLEGDEYPPTRNTVSLAMAELIHDKPIRCGKDLPTTDELKKVFEREQAAASADANYSVSRQSESGEIN